MTPKRVTYGTRHRPMTSSKHGLIALFGFLSLLVASTISTASAEGHRSLRCLRGESDARRLGCTQIVSHRSKKATPSKVAVYIDRAAAYRARSDLDRALAELDRAVRLEPRMAAALIARATIYRAKGELERAIADYSRGLATDKSNVVAYAGCVEIYRDTGDLQKARADFDQAIRLNPKVSAI